MRIRLRRKKNPDSPPRDPECLKQQFPDVSEQVLGIVQAVRKYTMTSPERLIALCNAVRYVSQQQIPGDVVECGVWKGGSMMAVASMLGLQNDFSRQLWLYDTFEGMSEPEAADIDHDGNQAAALLQKQNKQDADSIWCWSPLQEVQDNLACTQYPSNLTRFVQGKVETTIPAQAPDRISLLRLDTDWYASTMHELEHLFPRLAPGGVLIIDDYGHWQGCRRAVDQYFADNNISIFLNRIDYTGRLAIKTDGPGFHAAKMNRAA